MAETPDIRSGYMLPTYVRQIADVHHGLLALRLMISELRPENRDADAARALEDALRPLTRADRTRVFRLPDGDYLLCFPEEQTDAVRAQLVRLRFLVSDDPLAGYFNAVPGENNTLMRWWRLENDFRALRALAEHYETEAIKQAEARAKREGSRKGLATVDAAQAAAEAEELEVNALRERRAGGDWPTPEDAGDEPRWRPIVRPVAEAQPRDGRAERDGRRPIDVDTLDRLVNGLARADLSNHVRQQTVCAMVGNAPPQPLFSEIYVSIPDLRDTIAPRVALTSNRWLFQYFTETLDHRILAWLNRDGARLVRGGFSININVATILSEAFLKFEQALAAGVHGAVTLELRVEDVFADLEAYAFARDFVHQRGYRICIDSLEPDIMALLDRSRLGADMMKLFWRPDLPERISRGAGIDLARRLKGGEGPRTILARCDDPAAIKIGRALDISMFQGRHVDSLLGREGWAGVAPSGAS